MKSAKERAEEDDEEDEEEEMEKRVTKSKKNSPPSPLAAQYSPPNYQEVKKKVNLSTNVV